MISTLLTGAKAKLAAMGLTAALTVAGPLGSSALADDAPRGATAGFDTVIGVTLEASSTADGSPVAASPSLLCFEDGGRLEAATEASPRTSFRAGGTGEATVSIGDGGLSLVGIRAGGAFEVASTVETNDRLVVRFAAPADERLLLVARAGDRVDARLWVASECDGHQARLVADADGVTVETDQAGRLEVGETSDGGLRFDEAEAYDGHSATLLVEEADMIVVGFDAEVDAEAEAEISADLEAVAGGIAEATGILVARLGELVHQGVSSEGSMHFEFDLDADGVIDVAGTIDVDLDHDLEAIGLEAEVDGGAEFDLDVDAGIEGESGADIDAGSDAGDGGISLDIDGELGIGLGG